MGWSKTAPTLPSGSSWVQEQTTTFWANHWKLDTVRSIARLEGTSIAIKVVATMSNGSYGDFFNPGKYHLSATAGGTTSTNTTSYSMTKGTQTFYYVGTAAAGSTVTTVVGYVDSSASRISKTFTAPALLVTSLTISFDAQGGSACSSITRNKGATYGTLPTTTRRGYRFLGWSTDTTSANIVSSTTTITQSANFTLYAIWQFIGAVYIKVDGTWKYSPALYIKVNGKWI